MDFDMVIVGGGLVGASLACALKEHAFKIAVLDKQSSSLNSLTKTNLDARALALSFTSVQCLKLIGVWKKIVSEVVAILEVHISKQGYFGVTRLKASEHFLPALGYVVNADKLNQALDRTINTLPNVKIFRSAEIKELSKVSTDSACNSWKICLNNNQILTAKVLVAADGTESFLRKQQGIKANVHDYQQTAIVVNVGLSQSHKNIAYERFTSNGSIAFLPFGEHENQAKCVWVVPTMNAETLAAMSSSEFLQNIQDNFGYRSGRLVGIGKRIVYPLRSIIAEALYSDRLVLIGNAANTLHPIAAQGFNLGLRDAATLAEVFSSAQQQNQDIGSLETLKSYANLRYADHHFVEQISDRLAVPSSIQGLGIVACKWVPFLKDFITEWGVGKQPMLPKLCRGISL